MWQALLSGAAGGGGGGTYGNSGSSGVSTPVTTTAGGGVNQNFNLGSLGIGNTMGPPDWVWYVAAGVAVLLAWKMFRK